MGVAGWIATHDQRRQRHPLGAERNGSGACATKAPPLPIPMPPACPPRLAACMMLLLLDLSFQQQGGWTDALRAMAGAGDGGADLGPDGEPVAHALIKLRGFRQRTPSDRGFLWRPAGGTVDRLALGEGTHHRAAGLYRDHSGGDVCPSSQHLRHAKGAGNRQPRFKASRVKQNCRAFARVNWTDLGA